MTIPVPLGGDRAAVTALIDASLTSQNLIYAIRIGGTFREVRTRTVMAQRPPYPPLGPRPRKGSRKVRSVT